MTFIDVDFGANPQGRLHNLGLRLPTLRGQFRFHKTSYFEPPLFVHAAMASGTILQIGAYNSISVGNIGQVHTGRYCSIAPGINIGSNEHPTDWLTSSRIAHFPQMHDWDKHYDPDKVDFIRENRGRFMSSCKLTELGNDVWIGQGAFLKAGIKVGDGAIVAARAVVVKDVPPYAIVAGCPAKVMKMRFPEKTVERLMAVRWWRYCIYDFFGAPLDNIEAALDRIEEKIAQGEVEEYSPMQIQAKHLQSMFAAEAA